MKRFFVAFIFLLMSTTTVLASKGVPSNVILDGSAKGLVSIPSDTFLEFLDMMPGDKESGTIFIHNTDDSPFELYLKAERMTSQQEFDLLDHIALKVNYQDEVIYEGPMSGEEGLEDSIYLGTFNPNQEAELVAEIMLDGETSTENYGNQIAQVNWIFTALRENDKEPTQPDKPTSIPSQSKPVSPGTGDSSVILYVGLAAGSLMFLVMNNRRKAKQD